jgi:hypothetical protein
MIKIMHLSCQNTAPGTNNARRTFSTHYQTEEDKGAWTCDVTSTTMFSRNSGRIASAWFTLGSRDVLNERITTITNEEAAWCSVTIKMNTTGSNKRLVIHIIKLSEVTNQFHRGKLYNTTIFHISGMK